jgi:hypothetical protein
LRTFGLDATAYADSIVAFYETPLRLLGGNYAAGLAIPFVWVEAKAQVAGPLGTVQKRDTASGSATSRSFRSCLGGLTVPTQIRRASEYLRAQRRV